MSGNTADPGRSVLSRALAVLGCFTDEHPEQTLGGIVSATGLASATAYRLGAELVGWGGLARPSRGHSRIGTRLGPLGSLAPVHRDLRDTALPFLQDLAAVTGQVVHLVVLDGDRALFVERLAGDAEVRGRSPGGGPMPLHASGPGKVPLAHGPPELLAAVLSRGLERTAK